MNDLESTVEGTFYYQPIIKGRGKDNSVYYIKTLHNGDYEVGTKSDLQASLNRSAKYISLPVSGEIDNRETTQAGYKGTVKPSNLDFS